MSGKRNIRIIPIMTKQKTLQNYPMPDSTAIESRLLNMLILRPYDIDKVGDIVREDMFQDDRARNLWRTLKAMSANHEEINFATISTKADREYFVNGIIAQPQDIANDPIQVAHSLVDTHIKFLSYISAMNILTKVTTNATCAEIIDEFKALPEAVNNSVYCDSTTTAMDAAKELQDEMAMVRRCVCQRPSLCLTDFSTEACAEVSLRYSRLVPLSARHR